MNEEQLLTSLLGRTITDVSTDDDELALRLDDGRWIVLSSEEDELYLTVYRDEEQFSQ